MELRAAVGTYDAAALQYTLYTSAGGGVVRQRCQVVAERSGELGEAIPHQLHAVTGVAREPNDYVI